MLGLLMWLAWGNLQSNRMTSLTIADRLRKPDQRSIRQAHRQVVGFLHEAGDIVRRRGRQFPHRPAPCRYPTHEAADDLVRQKMADLGEHLPGGEKLPPKFGEERGTASMITVALVQPGH